MFRNKKKPSQTQHIPNGYELPAAQQVSTPVRGGKWLLEILLAGVIVIALLIGGVLVYNHIRGTTAPQPSKPQNVQQAPQTNQQKKPTNAPATTPQADSTNRGVVNQPNGQ